MSLISPQKAYTQVFAKHDFSRQHQIRILDIHGVSDSVYNELITQQGNVYISTLSIPGRSVANLEIPFQGFKFNYPGQASYDEPNPWTWTVKTPGDYMVRNSLEQLSFDTINDETGCGIYGIPCPDRTIDVAIIAPNCDVIRVYRFYGVYVEKLSAIEYDQTENNFTSFTVSWRYQYWRLVNAYDTGAIDNTDTSNTIDDVYNSYESKILNAKAGCAVGFTTPK